MSAAPFGRLGTERSRTILPSSLHEMHRRVGLRRDRETFALHVGDPHLGVPEGVREAFVRAIRDGHSYYCDAPGLPALREALSARLGGGRGPRVPVERVFVTPGSCQAIAAVLLALARDGAAALLPEIHWPMHLQQMQMAGFRPRFYGPPSYPSVSAAGGGGSGSGSEGDRLIESLERAYSDDVVVALINSPSNPGGEVLGEDALRRAYEWARRRGVWLISDEAYEDFVFEGQRGASLTTIDLERPDRERIVFSVHTFSKSYSMTGYRLGYVVAPSTELAGLIERVQQAMLVSPCTPVQYAGLAALEDTAHVKAHFEYVRDTRDEVVRGLRDAGLLWAVPRGGWYALVDLGAYCEDASVLCLRLLDEVGVSLAPGRDFAPPGSSLGVRLARLALCCERGATRRGLELLVEGAPRLARASHGARGPRA